MEKQTFEEYEQKRTDALEAFRNFLKECSKKKFTVQQFLMISTFAEEEIKKIVANVQIQTTVTEDQCDLHQHNLKDRRKKMQIKHKEAGKMNKKTAIAIVITVVLAEISKMLMNTTRWESTVLFMLIFLCIQVLLKE